MFKKFILNKNNLNIKWLYIYNSKKFFCNNIRQNFENIKKKNFNILFKNNFSFIKRHFYINNEKKCNMNINTFVTAKEIILNGANNFVENLKNTNNNDNKDIEHKKLNRNEINYESELNLNEHINNKILNDVDKQDDDEMKLMKLLNKKKIKKDIITISENAKKQIKKIIEKNNQKNKDQILKLFLITKGCNGLTYKLNFVSKNMISKNDEIIYDNQNILLVIDSKCVLFVINTIMDYYQDDLTEKFVFVNPNITSICPCGTSFHFSKK